MSLPIKSIKKGEGAVQISWTVGTKYRIITEEWKTVRMEQGNLFQIIVYRCYNHKDEIVVEIESCQGLTLTYKE